MTTTTTKPLFTRKQLIALLLPLIAEQALSVTIGLADTLMVSSVGEAAAQRACHRRCRRRQPVHRPPGAEERQSRRRPDPVHHDLAQRRGRRRGSGGAAWHPAGHLRLH